MKPADDRGSTLPLIIGFTTIGLLFIVLAVQITDIYLARARLHAIADSAVLAAAESFEPGTGDAPSIDFTDAGVEAAAKRFVTRTAADPRLSATTVRGSAHGASIEVRIKAHYRPVLIAPLTPHGITLEVSASSRGGLRR